MNIRYCIAAVSLGILAGPVLAAEDASPLKDQKQKLSYSFGVNLGKSWKSQDIELDFDILLRGIKDVTSGAKTLLTDQEMKEVVSAFSTEFRAKQEAKRKQLGEKNKQEGEAFLTANKDKPGIVTQPSGLQYKVLTEGKGESPKAGEKVTVNYRGTLIDGTEFDSSYQRGQPATFGVEQVIKGWTEALKLMKVGSKWQVFVPSNLAYGENGAGQKIGPNAALIFEVELISIQPAPPATTQTTTTQPVTSDIIKVPSAEEMKKGAKIEVIKKEDLEKK